MFLIENKELRCVLWLSLCFMFLFAADFTMVNMQKTVISSITNEREDFEVEGYTTVGIIYTFFAITLWFGPYLTHALGPKTTMVIASIGYLLYIVAFLIEDVILIYIGAWAAGVGAGILWPAQGQYIIGNSSPETTARNVAIFWIVFMSSSMIGNVFVYYTFHGKMYLDQTTRRTAIYFLGGINVLATLAFMMLPKPINNLKPEEYGPFKTMKMSLKILTSPKMRWTVITFCYMGLQQSFWNGIYSPSLGFTLAFGDSSKEMVALSGIFMSIGGVVGAMCPVVLSTWIRGQGFARRMIVLCGMVAQIGTYFISYVNLPDTSVFGNTEDVSLIRPPSVALALLGSFLINFGDSCFSTQVYSFIGEYYREHSAEAAALFKFVKGSSVAVSFFWCNHIGLHTQVTIMTTMAVIGVVAFFVADHGKISHPSVEQKKPVTSTSVEYDASCDKNG